MCACEESSASSRLTSAERARGSGANGGAGVRPLRMVYPVVGARDVQVVNTKMAARVEPPWFECTI